MNENTKMNNTLRDSEWHKKTSGNEYVRRMRSTCTFGLRPSPDPDSVVIASFRRKRSSKEYNV